MRHSMLITGKNDMIKEELFAHFWSEYECFSCSANFADIKNHLHRFTPDVMLYCLQDEERSGVQAILELQEILREKNTVLTVLGSKKDCDFFLACAPKLARFVFEKPINPNMISDCLVQFFDKRDVDSLLDQINALESKKRVMVIDDDPFMLKLMTGYLQNEYNVQEATSGKDAMNQLQKTRADLILLDYEMPEESGPVVLEHLHQNEATKDIPVIFLTSIMHREMIEKALLLKPQGYLLKPVNRDKLLEAIQNILG